MCQKLCQWVEKSSYPNIPDLSQPNLHSFGRLRCCKLTGLTFSTTFIMFMALKMVPGRWKNRVQVKLTEFSGVLKGQVANINLYKYKIEQWILKTRNGMFKTVRGDSRLETIDWILLDCQGGNEPSGFDWISW